MDYEIKGSIMQALEVTLRQGDSVKSEAGAMSWMTSGIEMATSGGGMGNMFKRAFAGESMFVTTYTCTAPKGKVAFAATTPGNIVARTLKEGEYIIVQRGSFMASQPSVKIEVAFSKKLSAGFFGGEGFVMQKISGPGLVFLSFDGELMEYTLGKGEMWKVDTGHVAMYEASVHFDTERVKGFNNAMFGEGLFLATLTGPGKIWLQTMPISNLAAAISPFIPRSS